VLRIRDERLWRWAAGSVFALLLTQLAIAQILPATPYVAEWPISEQVWWWSYFFPPVRLFEFVLGMLMARILKAGRWIGLGLMPSFALILVAYAFASFIPFQFRLNVVTIMPIALFITSVAALDVAGRKTGFGGATMVWLGNVSFGMYMVHQLVLLSAKRWLDGGLFGALAATLITLLALSASILGGWLLYTFIERPVMYRWGRTEPESSTFVRTSR
jgi:peptidoglycan/LPS O-acetylase OafA/YrhL